MDWWEDKIDQEVLHVVQEVIAEVRKEDPEKGKMEHKDEQEG